MGRFFVAVVVVCGLVLPCSTPAAEIIVKHDGTEIRGEIVGFQQGVYLIQIGGYTKRISEKDVKEIRDLGAPSVPAQAPVPVTAPAAPAMPAFPALGGNPLEMLSSLSQMQSNNPALAKLMELQQQRGPDNPLTPEEVPPELRGQLEQMQANPGMMQMMSNFKDPAFQQRLLENLKKMRQSLNPSANPNDDPNMKALEGLFQRLNTAGQSTR